ncbi:MAG: UbiH/UbiF/VisC/COQ6 family ubiquinone biosynthesis hydroxylase [Alphaproteobacteria bacterium]
MSKKHDVIVVGGGLAGLSLTIMLADKGVRVLCLDRDRPSRQTRPAFDGRTTALAAAAKSCLGQIGVWRELAPHASPIHDILVTDQGAPRTLHFDHRVAGEPFGWIVENHRLRTALGRRVAALPSASLSPETQVAGIETSPHGAKVAAMTAQGEKIFQANLIAGADGRHSFCRRQAGIAWHGQDYWQASVVCVIEHDKPHHHLAVEDFLPGGPLASLPMRGNRSSIVWTHHRTTAASLQQMDEQEFCRRLEAHLAPMLGGVRLAGKRFVYGLSCYHAARYTAPRLALAGEAAHVMHPIAGQGFNLSMRDNQCLAGLVDEALGLGLDCGGREVLRRYQRARRADNCLMLAATDGLDRLFSNSVPGLRLVRQTGLAAVDRMPKLKKFFMRAAMGHLAVT